MDSDHADHEPWYRSRLNLALAGFLTVIAFYLITEHTAHTLGVLPYLLLLLCPLMHFFGHGGHGGHGGHCGHEKHDGQQRAETEGEIR
jgi:hypothetical protein